MRIPAFIHVPSRILDEPVGSWPLGLAGRLIESVRDAIADRDGARQLAALDDRMLADIGLDRADVPRQSRPVYDFLR